MLLIQAFGHKPVLDHLRYRVGILVHHHHVGVAFEAAVGEVDDVDGGVAGGAGFVVVGVYDLPVLGPAASMSGLLCVKHFCFRRSRPSR